MRPTFPTAQLHQHTENLYNRTEEIALLSQLLRETCRPLNKDQTKALGRLLQLVAHEQTAALNHIRQLPV